MPPPGLSPLLGRATCVALAALLGCGSAADEPPAGDGDGGSSGIAGAGGWAGKSDKGSGGSGGLLALPCDPGFSFSQDPAQAGQPFGVSFAHDDGFAHVAMDVQGPGTPATTWVGHTGGAPNVWSWTVSGHAAGTLAFTFKKDADGAPGVAVASCQLHSVGSGSGATGGAGGNKGGAPPVNRYGMGYVNEGSAADHELTAKLTGPGGFVTVIFADIKPGRTGAEQSWKDSISAAYARDLIPVIRMAPPWGDRRVRNMGESPTSYQALAQAYKAVIQDLPKREQYPLYVQVHNEPNLCYEWACDSGTLSAQQMAAEYASLLRDAAKALHSLGDPRILVMNGALAPGGVNHCECASQNGPPGTLATTFLEYMAAAVPGVFDQIDAFASHSYPAKGEGWGFFSPYSESAPGLKYFEKELAAIGKPNMKVLITETGWTVQHESYSWSREQVAGFTVDALKNVWLTHPSIIAFTPFILRDGNWDKFAWVKQGGEPYPVYDQVRAYRCAQAGAQSCQ